MSNNVAIINSDQVKTKAKTIISWVHGITDPLKSDPFFEKEKFFFLKMLEENPKYKEATEMSIVGTFLEVIGNGLSFEKAQNHIYVMTRSVKNGNVFETRMSYEIAKNGAMYLVKKAGSVRDITDPTIVYDGDVIDIMTENGALNISHSPAIPRISDKILGAFCFVITPDSRRDGFWYPIEKIERLKKYSQKQNKVFDKDTKAYKEGKANDLYTSGKDGQIDEGFFLTKVVKAAIKNYSKQPIYFGRIQIEDGMPDTDPQTDVENYYIQPEESETVTNDEAAPYATQPTDEAIIPESF